MLYAHADHSLSSDRSAMDEGQTHKLRYIPSVGVEAGGDGSWWGNIPWDQRGTDAFSLVYDSDTLTQNLEILGFPRAVLHVSADAPLANWIVRISDVAPDGTVTQVGGAGLSGAQRNSSENPEALVPGEVYKLEIDLHFTSWIFPKGHRIRLAVNNAAWPMVWPTPYKMTTTLGVDGASASHIILPVIPESDQAQPEFLVPVKDPELPSYGELAVDKATDSDPASVWKIERSPKASETRIIESGKGGRVYPWGTIRYFREVIQEVKDDDPARASVVGKTGYSLEIGDRTVDLKGELALSSDQENFYYIYTRQAWENGKLIREKTWEETIPRDHH
jgi:hypothetical protein